MPGMNPDQLAQLLESLQPQQIPGNLDFWKGEGGPQPPPNIAGPALAQWAQMQEALRQQQAARQQQLAAAGPQQAAAGPPNLLGALRELPYAQTGPATRVGNLDNAGRPYIMMPNALGPMPAAPTPQTPPGWGQRSVPFQSAGEISPSDPDFGDIYAALEATGLPVRMGMGGRLGVGTTEWATTDKGQRIQDMAGYDQMVAQNRAALTDPTKATYAFTTGRLREPYTTSDPAKREAAQAEREAVLGQRELNRQAKGMGVSPQYVQASLKPAEQRTAQDWIAINAQLYGPQAAAQLAQSDPAWQQAQAIAQAVSQLPQGADKELVNAVIGGIQAPYAKSGGDLASMFSALSGFFGFGKGKTGAKEEPKGTKEKAKDTKVKPIRTPKPPILGKWTMGPPPPPGLW